MHDCVSRSQIFKISLALAATLCVSNSHAISPDEGGHAFFRENVEPILRKNCYRCHSQESARPRGGLYVDLRAGLLHGGSRGPAIVPGNAEQSLIIQAVRHVHGDVQMPPNRQLPARDIEVLANWIQRGAPDPRDGELPNGKNLSAHDHWAFNRPVKPRAPKVNNQDWPRTELDRFVLAKLEGLDLHPNSPAEKHTLIRRLSYDIVGLPPTADEVDHFVRDVSDDAIESVVDRLLSSPHFGERWARHWLDVARFADTKGFYNAVHPHAAAYRDWVIRAFNRDMPYDRFVRYQLAADQLIDSPHGEDLAAMGFLTVGNVFKDKIHDVIDDRIDVVSRGLQGLTVTCARCHDHMYDPISTADYYSLYGVFASCSEQLVRIGKVGRQDSDFEEGYRERIKAIDRLVAEGIEKTEIWLRELAAEYMLATTDLKALPPAEFGQQFRYPMVKPFIVRKWANYLDERREEPVFIPWFALTSIPEADLAHRATRLLEEIDRQGQANAMVVSALRQEEFESYRDVANAYGELFRAVDARWQASQLRVGDERRQTTSAFMDEEDALRRVLYGQHSPTVIDRSQPLKIIRKYFYGPEGWSISEQEQRLERWIFEATDPVPHAVVLIDDPLPIDAPIFERGSPSAPGEIAPRRWLELLDGDERPRFKTSGRLEIARRIASRDNPLTARVMVNRIWLCMFGEGIISTPDDFGTQGDPPSHPELLDWLAHYFMDHDWSVKDVVRLIACSAAYRQSSQQGLHCAAAEKVDPKNRLLWRANRRRLDFESLRDSILATSGSLDARLHGRSVDLFRKPFPVRRTVYGRIDRQKLPGTFRTFDMANPNVTTARRHETTSPLQSLYLMNNSFVIEQAQTLVGSKEFAGLGSSQERATAIFRAVYQRPPTPAEYEQVADFLRTPTNRGEDGLTSWEQLAHTLLLSNEFVFQD